MGRVISDRFLMLHVVRHGMAQLVHSDYTREAAASTCLIYNLQADFQWHTLVTPLNSGTNVAPASVQALLLAVVRS